LGFAGGCGAFGSTGAGCPFGAWAAGAGATGGAAAVVLGGTGVGTSGSAQEVAGIAMVSALALVTVAIARLAHIPLRRVEVGST
jgi:hypothetical protein